MFAWGNQSNQSVQPFINVMIMGFNTLSKGMITFVEELKLSTWEEGRRISILIIRIFHLDQGVTKDDYDYKPWSKICLFLDLSKTSLNMIYNCIECKIFLSGMTLRKSRPKSMHGIL